MGDEEIAQLVLLLQILEEVDNLRLHRHVECRDRLVANHKLRIQRKRSCDTNSLTLTARELVRVAVFVEGLQTAVVHDLIDVVMVLAPRHKIVLTDRLTDDFADRQSRREGGERILEDDLHLHAQVVQFVLRNIVDLFSVEQHLSRSLSAV